MAAKVLVVDDSRELLAVYEAVLHELSDFDVRVDASPLHALELARTWHPDLVITDLMMPELSGLELITRIRSDNPPPVPSIVVVSGFPNLEAEALRRGAAHFQIKPVLPSDLVDLARSILENRAPSSDIRQRAIERRNSAWLRADIALGPDAFDSRAIARARRVVEFAARYLGNAIVTVLVIQQGVLRVAVSSESKALPEGSPVSEHWAQVLDVVRSGSSLVVPDLASMPFLFSPARASIGMLAAAPVVMLGDVTIGAVAVTRDRPGPFDASDLHIVEILASNGADLFAGRGLRQSLSRSGVLRPWSWSALLAAELGHMARQTLGVALFECTPDERAHVVARELPLAPRIAFGEAQRGQLAVYALDGQHAVQRAVHAIVSALHRSGTVRYSSSIVFDEIEPSKDPEVILRIASSVLRGAEQRGRGTNLRMELKPEQLDAPQHAEDAPEPPGP